MGKAKARFLLLNDKINQLVSDYGFESVDEALAEVGFDSIVPGICMVDGCDYSTEVEPDQREGWCENCCDNTVKSLLVLLGVI